MNNMYNFDGIGFDPITRMTLQDTYNNIWLDSSHFKVLEEVKY